MSEVTRRATHRKRRRAGLRARRENVTDNPVFLPSLIQPLPLVQAENVAPGRVLPDLVERHRARLRRLEHVSDAPMHLVFAHHESALLLKVGRVELVVLDPGHVDERRRALVRAREHSRKRMRNNLPIEKEGSVVPHRRRGHHVRAFGVVHPPLLPGPPVELFGALGLQVVVLLSEQEQSPVLLEVRERGQRRVHFRDHRRQGCDRRAGVAVQQLQHAAHGRRPDRDPLAPVRDALHPLVGRGRAANRGQREAKLTASLLTLSRHPVPRHPASAAL
jgi:hypothetical protein